MSKLDEWQAIFDEYREAQQAYLNEKQTRLTHKTRTRYRNAVDNLARADTQHVARVVLQVALAAQRIARHNLLATYNEIPKSDALALIEALKGLEDE